MDATPILRACGLTLSVGGRTLLDGLDFEVRRGEVLAVMGPSGAGKSTLMRHLVGLAAPAAGQVLIDGIDLHRCDDVVLARLRRRFGVMFQTGALWSSLSVGENLTATMELAGVRDAATRERRARFKLAMVGMADAYHLFPAELSGGMRKRAALARALALEPAIVFLDEPGSGLDPANSARLDALILQLRHHLGTTVVLVSHEVASILRVADRALYLDENARTMTALGPPERLLRDGPEPVRAFLRSGVGEIRQSGAGGRR
ncbi:MAG: hypothetical protein RIS35_2056 [Pseudomonadota bacterium]|jgi:phospholipid/cholesterol/gamma-HCH transport system ATP-binding protein